MKQAIILLALLAAATLHAAEPAAVNYDEDPYVILVGEAHTIFLGPIPYLFTTFLKLNLLQNEKYSEKVDLLHSYGPNSM